MRAPSSEPSGVRLLRLINTRIGEITTRELMNDGRICLYGTGEYWNCFDRSAYFLSGIFPNLEYFVVNPSGHRSSVIGVSVPDKVLRRYLKGVTFSRKGSDYLEFKATPCESNTYANWHEHMVKGFMDAII